MRLVEKKQEVEIQLSQQRLFHLTVCPCVNGKVNSGQAQKHRLKKKKKKKKLAATSTPRSPYAMCSIIRVARERNANSVNSAVI